MLRIVCRLFACLCLLCTWGCSKKKMQEKGLQWRTQCEQMVLKGADGLLSHHDCYKRCVSHYSSFCVGKCTQALQEAKATHQESTDQCKKDIRLYMGKKCRHVCEMTSTELQAYRISFAQGLNSDEGLSDSPCPCKNQKLPPLEGSASGATGNTTAINSLNDPTSGFNISGPTTPYDLPWLALPGTGESTGPSADLPWQPLPVLQPAPNYGGLSNDLPWLTSGRGQATPQNKEASAAEDDLTARKAETEKEAEEDASTNPTDGSTPVDSKSAGDSFFKGFKPLAKFSLDPKDPNGEGTGLLDTLKQDAKQLKGSLTKDVDQLKNLSLKDDGTSDEDGTDPSKAGAKNPLEKLKQLEQEAVKDVKGIGEDAKNAKSSLTDVRSLFSKGN